MSRASGRGGKSQWELEPSLRGAPCPPPCAPRLPLTWMSPPACRRASHSGPLALAPPPRLRPRSAAACGWRPPSGRRGRGLAWCCRRRPGARRRSWSASAGRCWCPARLRGARRHVGGEASPSLPPPPAAAPLPVRAPSVSRARPCARHSQADGVRGRGRRSGSSWGADLASGLSGPYEPEPCRLRGAPNSPRGLWGWGVDGRGGGAGGAAP